MLLLICAVPSLSSRCLSKKPVLSWWYQYLRPPQTRQQARPKSRLQARQKSQRQKRSWPNLKDRIYVKISNEITGSFRRYARFKLGWFYQKVAYVVLSLCPQQIRLDWSWIAEWAYAHIFAVAVRFQNQDQFWISHQKNQGSFFLIFSLKSRKMSSYGR